MEHIGAFASAQMSVSGGGAPEWVPENAAIYIDFVNDRAWTAVGGEVAINTLVGSDPNTVSGWDTTEYVPENLSGDGYLQSTAMAFIGAARTAIVAGATTVFSIFNSGGGTPGGSFLIVMSTDGESVIEADFAGGNTLNIYSNGDYDRTSGAVLNATNFNKIAITLTATRSEFAANGSSVLEDTLGEDDWPTSGDSQMSAAAIQLDNDYLQTVTIYDPLPSTVGLSALSEIA